MCGGRSRILHYEPQTQTNNLNAPNAEWESPIALSNLSFLLQLF